MSRFNSLSFAIALSLLTGTCVGQNSLRSSSSVRNAFQSTSAAAAKATVGIAVDGKQVALGCVVSDDGEVVTKASLIPSGEVRLLTSGGKSVPAKRIGTNEPFDVMLLKAASGNFSSLKFAVDKPGIGRLVAALRDKGTVAGVGMVIVEANRTGLRKLGSAPEQPSAYLGINLAMAEGGGLRVTKEVPRDAPAFPYGIRKDDVITAIAGYKVNRVADLLRILKTKKPGDKVNVKVLRDGEQKRSTVRLGDRGIDKWGGGPFSKRRYNIPNVITHDIRIRPEECGGPLVSATGEVVGMNIARALRIATYAVPGQSINKIIADIRATQVKAEPTAKPKANNIAKAALSIPPPTPGTMARKQTLAAPAAKPRVVAEPIPPSPQPPKPPAAKFDGSVLSYTASVSEPAIERFISLGQRNRSRIVVIDGGQPEPAYVSNLKACWKKWNGVSFHRISVTTLIEANDADRFSLLNQCSGVWVTSDVPAEALSGTTLAKLLKSLRTKRIAVALPHTSIE